MTQAAADRPKVSTLDALRTHPAFVRVFSRLHVWLYLKSGGKILADVLGAPVLLLTTVGRKSGQEANDAAPLHGGGRSSGGGRVQRWG